MWKSSVSIVALAALCAVVNGCALQMSYDDCYNKQYIKVTWCETKNTGPLYDYYSCLCEAKKNLYNCYAICSDDAIIQQQAMGFQLDVTNTCSQADNYKNQQTTTTTTVPVTSAPPPTAKPTPSPSSSSTLSTTTSTARPATTITIMSSAAPRTPVILFEKLFWTRLSFSFMMLCIYFVFFTF